MSAPFLEVRGLARWFDSVRAVQDVSFDIAVGQVVGLIGANGAGKTTTMRILATLDVPDRGTVRLGGIDLVAHPTRVRRRIGWMPDHFEPYRETTVGDYLDFFGRAYGLRGRALAGRVNETMEFTELVPLVDRPVDKLSKGQTQRVCLARMLLSDPDLLILDEPAAGLDPQARLEFKNLVRLLRGQGKTLLISSHILSELGEMCDSLLFIDAGRVMHHGDAASLQRAPGNGHGGNGDTASGVLVDIVVHGDPAPLREWLLVRPGWRTVEEKRDGVRASFASAAGDALAAELRRLTGDGVAVVEFRRVERRLEEAFVEMLQDGRRRHASAARPAEPPPLPAAGA